MGFLPVLPQLLVAGKSDMAFFTAPFAIIVDVFFVFLAHSHVYLPLVAVERPVERVLLACLLSDLPECRENLQIEHRVSTFA